MNQDKIDLIFEQQRQFHSDGICGLTFRKSLLKKLKDTLKSCEKQIIEALKDDLGKPPVESYTSEYISLVKEIPYVTKNLKKWMRPQKYGSPFFMKPGRYYTERCPQGIVLIISPWNYPINLSIAPLIYAVSGGNSVILKPSELAPASSRLLCSMINNNFESRHIRVVEGDGQTVQYLIGKKPDFVFFTGGASIGKKVYQKAAENLIPLALELGGKNPCIVDTDKDLKTTVRRIVWAKFFNAGQTCVAPDYCLVRSSLYGSFCKEIKQCIEKFYGTTENQHRDIGTIVNINHFNRLTKLITDSHIMYGGNHDRKSGYIEPTLLNIDDLDHPSMTEEIFGPILPIIRYDREQSLFDTINKYPEPLIIYCFTKNPFLKKRLKLQTRSGNICFNLTLHRMILREIPFGGVGRSGFGKYHGQEGFNTFTYDRSISSFNGLKDPDLVYPPYKGKINQIRKFGKYFI
ncbi:MAG: aldehyde dehydrogenase family protein [Chitinispirillia bacterium]